MPWKPRFSEEEVRAAVAASRSLAEACRRLGLRSAGSNPRTIKRLIAHYEIGTSHFDPIWSLRAQRSDTARPLVEILVEHSSYNRAHLKRRLYVEGRKQR